ncbi:hypothetical protein EDB84DRAFT_1473506 [Lactarius hengduanensis]|nr:hypothetical protein EDB84DRAFT_1473506 [Lactarius hengduanensis]
MNPTPVVVVAIVVISAAVVLTSVSFTVAVVSLSYHCRSCHCCVVIPVVVVVVFPIAAMLSLGVSAHPAVAVWLSLSWVYGAYIGPLGGGDQWFERVDGKPLSFSVGNGEEGKWRTVNVQINK